MRKSLPKLKVNITTKENTAPTKTDVVADTGAQVNAAGETHLKHFGLAQEDLPPRIKNYVMLVVTLSIF